MPRARSLALFRPEKKKKKKKKEENEIAFATYHSVVGMSRIIVHSASDGGINGIHFTQNVLCYSCVVNETDC